MEHVAKVFLGGKASQGERIVCRLIYIAKMFQAKKRILNLYEERGGYH